jgi:hypothetical protein
LFWSCQNIAPLSSCKNSSLGQAWWYMPLILTPGRLRQEDGELEASLSYIVSSKPCLKIARFRWLRACNPSYSGGRDQEDYSSRPAQANSSRDPITKIGLVEWLKVSPSSNPSTTKKKKKKADKQTTSSQCHLLASCWSPLHPSLLFQDLSPVPFFIRPTKHLLYLNFSPFYLFLLSCPAIVWIWDFRPKGPCIKGVMANGIIGQWWKL